jgi:DNA ligase D-like protein (predicted 3'-phosphoesterase)
MSGQHRRMRPGGHGGRPPEQRSTSGRKSGAARSNVTSLDEYRRRRGLRRSGEPGGGKPRGRKPRFVVQLHYASTQHYDFRLEVDGVLKSWAVPRGPSTDPKQKRLAVATEDHPLDYADFEGVIEPGNYGAGKVLLWDRGYYVCRSHGKRDEPTDASDAVDRGHITVELHGRKLRGGYSLTRLAGGADDQWLLVKVADEFADSSRDVERSRPESVKSCKLLGEVTDPTGKAR